MNRYDGIRLGTVVAIIGYVAYQVVQEYAEQMASVEEIDTVLGLASYYVAFVVDVTWFIVTEPVLLVASVVYLLLVWPYVQPPY